MKQSNRQRINKKIFIQLNKSGMNKCFSLDILDLHITRGYVVSRKSSPLIPPR